MAIREIVKLGDEVLRTKAKEVTKFDESLGVLIDDMFDTMFKADGVGLAAPQSMELCIRDVGRVKVIFAAVCAAIGKLFGKRGVFYNICGMKARAIDGPSKDNLPPYDHYAKMAPDKPDEVAEKLKSYTGAEVVVIDANDIGVNVLGRSRGVEEEFAAQVFRDNPLDQGLLQTPIAIVRKAG